MTTLRRLILTFVIATSGLLAGGCWDVRDISDLTPVLAMGFDHSGSTWTATIAEAVLAPGGGAQYTGPMHTGSGPTLVEAIDDLRTHLSRKLYLGSARVFVLGKGVMESHSFEVLHLLSERNEVDSTGFLAGTCDTAEKLLGRPDGALGITSVRLLKEFEGLHESRDGHTTTRIWEAERDLFRPDRQAFFDLPVYAALQTTSIKAMGTGVIGPDGKFALMLDREGSVALHWLQNRPGRNILTLADGSLVKMTALHAGANFLDPQHLSLQVTARVALYDYKTHIVDSSVTDRLAQLTAQDVVRRLETLIPQLQKAGVDPAHWGEMATEAGISGFDIRNVQVNISASASIAPNFTPSF